MSIDFSKFDKQVNVDQLKADIAEAQENGMGEFKEVPAGIYTCTIDNLEIRETKGNNPGRPMLSAQFRIVGDEDGNKIEFSNSCIFMNRVLYGTKNDGNMIASAIGWLKDLDSGIDITFESYSQFTDLVMDIAEEVQDLSFVVEYDPDAFNNISIDDVFE